MRTILPEKENPVLRGKAQDVPVSEIKGARMRALIKEMKALLAVEEYGVALAAPQVGETLRLFIISGRAIARGKRNAPDTVEAEVTPRVSRGVSSAVQGAEEATPPSVRSRLEPTLPDHVYINPKLLKMSRGKSTKHEGCLSIRGKWGEVPRAEKVTVRFYDEHGKQSTRGASGFLAHIFQHELDHLEGVLYTDKATKVYDEKPEEK